MHRNIFLQRVVFSVTMVLLLTIPISCFRNYYKISKRPVTTSESDFTSLKNESRYFILRSGNRAWHMNNISVSKDQRTIKCDLEDIPMAHQLHLREGEHQNFQYKASRSTKAVLSEVHFYIPLDTSARYGAYTFEADKVTKIELIEKDHLRTFGSQFGGVVAVLASVAAGVLLIAVLTSCPFVSAYDGAQFSMQGEIYGGAVYPQLSRNDYIRLSMAPTPDGNLQLKISNELNEIQHTDLAELITITHSANVSILHDQEGNMYSIKHATTPQFAITNNHIDVTNLLSKKDDQFMEFDDSSRANGGNEVMLNFEKQPGADHAKLVLRVKNTYWLDRLYGKMLEGFGDYYNTFVTNQKNRSAEELNKWIDEQMIPLKVSVKTKAGWKTITGLKTSGPIAYRDVVVPITLDKEERSTQIKLSSGFMFWDLDYAAIDYSDNEVFSIVKQTPVKAIDETGKDVVGELSSPDDNFLVQPVPGNVTTIVYDYHAPPEGQTNTYILHSKGWYETLRNFKGKPRLAFLNEFKKPGRLSSFSMEMYRHENVMTGSNAKN